MSATLAPTSDATEDLTDRPAPLRVPAGSTASKRLTGTDPGRRWPWLLPLGGAAALYTVSLQQFDPERVDGMGLISAAPATYWAAGAVLLCGLGALLGSQRPSRAIGLAYLVGLIVLLHATPGFVEPHPRFPTAWTHVGFVDQIIEAGTVATDYDARYNWPGAFSLGAFVVELAGVDTARALLRWAPVAMNLMVLASMLLIVQQVTRDRRVQLAGACLAILAGWVGQDYLAPQAVAFIAYLTIIGVLLRYYRDRSGERLGWFSLLERAERWAPGLVGQQRLGELAGRGERLDVRRSVALYVIVLLVAGVVAFSHQLTPFVMAAGTLVMVLFGRVTRPLLPVTIVIGAIAWVAFGATTFLRSNLVPMLESVGDLQGSVDENIQGRVGGSPARELVLQYRMALTAVVLLLALVGLYRQWRARRADWAVFALALVPAPLLAANSYGGEVLLRVTLFMLPFLAVLAAFAFFREDAHRPRLAAAVFTVVAVLALPAFVVARFGNESFERIYSGDIAAWEHVTTVADADTQVLVLNFAGPWRFSSLLDTGYRVFPDERSEHPDRDNVDEMVRDGGDGSLLLLGEAGARYSVDFLGETETWQDDLADELLALDGYEEVFTEGRSRILRWDSGEDTERSTADRAVGPSGQGGRSGR